MREELRLCCCLNDLLYEVKITLPRNSILQARIDKVMKDYQRYFGEKEQLHVISMIKAAHEAANNGDWDRVKEIYTEQ